MFKLIATIIGALLSGSGSSRRFADREFNIKKTLSFLVLALLLIFQGYTLIRLIKISIDIHKYQHEAIDSTSTIKLLLLEIEKLKVECKKE